MNNKKTITAQEFDRLNNMFDYFKDNFVQKRITYTYIDAENKMQNCSIVMQKPHFYHLTGLSYSGKALNFYNSLENKTLGISELSHNSKGYSKLKLGASHYLEGLKSENVNICEKKEFVHLKFDKSIRDDNISLALKKVNTNFIPISFTNLRKDKKKAAAIQPVYPVIKIEEYDFVTKEKKILFDKNIKSGNHDYERKIDNLLQEIFKDSTIEHQNNLGRQSKSKDFELGD